MFAVVLQMRRNILPSPARDAWPHPLGWASQAQQDGDVLAGTTGEKSPGVGMSRRDSCEASPPRHPRTDIWEIFGFHHNTTPMALTPHLTPCWLCPLLGYFSHTSCGLDYVESNLSMSNPACLMGFPAAEPGSTAQCP